MMVESVVGERDFIIRVVARIGREADVVVMDAIQVRIFRDKFRDDGDTILPHVFTDGIDAGVKMIDGGIHPFSLLVDHQPLGMFYEDMA